MIKWLIVAVLVAGSVGFLWTAPWKDEVDSIRDRVAAAAASLDEYTQGDCKAVGTAAGANVGEAVQDMIDGAQEDADARTALRRQADQIRACLDRLPKDGAGWRALEQRLRAASEG